MCKLIKQVLLAAAAEGAAISSAAAEAGSAAPKIAVRTIPAITCLHFMYNFLLFISAGSERDGCACTSIPHLPQAYTFIGQAVIVHNM